MGLYDTICVQTRDLPIPNEWKYLFADEENYQTKSLDNSLTHYILYKGRLLHESVDVVSVPEEDRPYPKDHRLSFLGSIEYKNRRHEFHRFTGEIIFYTSFDHRNSSLLWFEFSVQILEGEQIGEFEVVELP